MRGYAQTDSFSIYFQTAITSLNATQTQHIDSLLYAGKIGAGRSVSIVGYADEPGTTTLNKSIADKRAASIKAYLISSGIEPRQIQQCTGLGNLVRTGEDMGQRRVDIVVVGSIPRTPDTALGKNVVLRKPKRTLHDLGKMKPGELMVMENLLFKVSLPVFEKESMPILDELVDVMKEYPALVLKFEGHVCCGTKDTGANKLELGYSLSVLRARAVKDYLVAHDIKSNRLSFQGYGFSRPKVYPEVTQEDMYQNRRVEVRVMANK